MKNSKTKTKVSKKVDAIFKKITEELDKREASLEPVWIEILYWPTSATGFYGPSSYPVTKKRKVGAYYYETYVGWPSGQETKIKVQVVGYL